jgi:hypothetical protein
LASPGAATETNGPELEELTCAPLMSTPATAITPGRAAGYTGPARPVLPAAATTTTPLAIAFSTAASTSADFGVYSDRLMTVALWSTA